MWHAAKSVSFWKMGINGSVCYGKEEARHLLEFVPCILSWRTDASHGLEQQHPEDSLDAWPNIWLMVSEIRSQPSQENGKCGEVGLRRHVREN